MRHRRAVVGLSLVGMASMAATSLLQTGVIRHLPDPPLRGFNSDKVNLSQAAFPLGIPDGTLALATQIKGDTGTIVGQAGGANHLAACINKALGGSTPGC